MKKMIIAMMLLVTCMVGFTSVVHAQDFTSQLDDVQTTVGFTQTSVSVVVGQLIISALSILGVVLLILVIYAGFLWMTAGGDSDKTKKAKQYMINAVIGLIIIMGAYAITDFIIYSIEGW